MKKLYSLRKQKKEALEKAESILESADFDGREITDLEKAQIDDYMQTAERLQKRIEVEEKMEEQLKSMPAEEVGGLYDTTQKTTTSTNCWMDAQGQQIKVYSPAEKMGASVYSVGKYLKGILTGNWVGAEAEHKLYATTTTNVGAGGYLMPSVLHSSFIDLMRAQSTLVSAGAQTVDLLSNSDKIARVVTDPQAVVKTELDDFDPTSPTFDLVSFKPYTIGCWVMISQELASDAANLPQILETTFAAAVGQKLDLMGLYGSGSGESLGLCNYSNINFVPVDTFSYDTILDGLEQVELQNCYSSNAYILNPSTSNTLSKLKAASGDGQYLVKPTEVASLEKLVSTNVSASDLIVGDFSNLFLGVRRSLIVESSAVAGGAFQKYGLAFRAVIRADWQVARPKSFALCTQDISGIPM